MNIELLKVNCLTILLGFVDFCSFKKNGVKSCPNLHLLSTIVVTKTVPTSVAKSTPSANKPRPIDGVPTVVSKSTPVINHLLG